MSDEVSELRRVVRQRLESLRRSGLDWIPTPAVLNSTQIRSAKAAGPLVEVQQPEIAPPPTAAPVPIPASEPHVIPRSRPSEPRPGYNAPPVLAASLFEEPTLDAEIVAPEERAGRLELIRAVVAQCARCPHLAESRTQTVFGEGNPNARLMFIGEAPGADEDRTGRPFVGKAGMLLTDMITKGMGLTREEVYIANILKSRPPDNRDPEQGEIMHCLPFLERQLAVIRPEFICLLGRISAQTLLDTALSMGRLRGKWHKVRGIPAIATYHPSYLLRNPSAKKDAWQDLQMLMQAMGIKPPVKGAPSRS